MGPLEYEDQLDGVAELLTGLATLYNVVQVRDPSGTGGLEETEVVVAGGPFPCGVGPVLGRERIAYSQEVAIADALLYFLPSAPVKRTQVAYVTDPGWAGSRRFVFLGVTRVSGQGSLIPVAATETS